MHSRAGGPADGRAGALGTRVGERLRLVHAGLRRILGMPDYDEYVRHCRLEHPERSVPTERQFFEEYLRARYEGGPTRCC